MMFINLSLRYVAEHYVNFSKRISPLISRPCRKTYQAKNLYKICRHMSNSNSKLEANVRGHAAGAGVRVKTVIISELYQVNIDPSYCTYFTEVFNK